MDENIVENYSTSDEKSAKNKAWFLFIVFYLLFTVFNILLFVVIFKTSWPMPRYFHYVNLFDININEVFFSTIICGTILYLFFSAFLTRRALKKFLDDTNFLPRFASIRTLIVISVSILTISLLFAYPSYGASLLLIPAILVIAIECVLFMLGEVFVSMFIASSKSFLYILVIIVVFLLIGLLVIVLNYASLLPCTTFGLFGTADYECIANQAKAQNNIRLCEKTYSPNNPMYCYNYLAKIERDPSYCEYIWESHEDRKEMCISDVFRLLSEKERPLKFPEIKYEQSEQTASLGVQVILDEWFYNHGGRYTGFNTDSNNTDKINKVLEKVEKKYGYHLEYFLDVRDQAFILKVRAEDNKKRFYCVDAPSNWSFIDILGNNFHDDKNCLGESMDNYTERNIESRRRTMYEPMRRPMGFEKWYNQELPDAIYDVR